MAVRRPVSNPIGDFLTFRWMITPLLIQAFFWLGTLGCLLCGGRMMVLSFVSRPDPYKDREPLKVSEYRNETGASRYRRCCRFRTSPIQGSYQGAP